MIFSACARVLHLVIMLAGCSLGLILGVAGCCGFINPNKQVGW